MDTAEELCLGGKIEQVREEKRKCLPAADHELCIIW